MLLKVATGEQDQVVKVNCSLLKLNSFIRGVHDLSCLPCPFLQGDCMECELLRNNSPEADTHMVEESSNPTEVCNRHAVFW